MEIITREEWWKKIEELIIARKRKGVITSDEAFERSFTSKDLDEFSFDDAFFFTDDFLFGWKLLHIDFSGSIGFPLKVKPRPGVEDGVVDTIKKFILVFHRDKKQITTVQELADYLFSNNEKLNRLRGECDGISD